MNRVSLIVGAYHRPPAKSLLAILPAGCELGLRPEPTNPYDSGAVQVIVATSQIPAGQYQTLEVLAEGQGFQLAEILAQEEWQLGYLPSPNNKKAMQSGKWASNLDWTGQVPGKARLGFSDEGEPTVMLEPEAEV